MRIGPTVNGGAIPVQSCKVLKHHTVYKISVRYAVMTLNSMQVGDLGHEDRKDGAHEAEPAGGQKLQPHDRSHSTRGALLALRLAGRGGVGGAAVHLADQI
ncbi:hypothetical protein ON010_g3620 [Phytophthora cinnamomi]|nr:hypothetical protein ON010_g3620 [Phytophthora cinnamomi]